MTHALVKQLRFARTELQRCLEGVSEADAQRRLMPMNCISWIVGHLAAQENYLWNIMAQGLQLHPELYQRVGFGMPPSTPPLEEMWAAWREITAAADLYLETLSAELLLTHLEWQGETWRENVGTSLQRNFLHYWFHIGEAHAIRQLLGHPDLPQFVGDFGPAVYRPG